MGKLTISISEDLYRMLKSEAVRSHRSICQVVDERLRSTDIGRRHFVSWPGRAMDDPECHVPPTDRFSGLEI